MKKSLALVGLLLLASCAAENTAATAVLKEAGVQDNTAARAIVVGNTVGQLACALAGGGFVLPVGANVVGASAKAVADLCTVTQPGSVPSALPPGAVPVAVTVAQSALAVFNASKPLN